MEEQDFSQLVNNLKNMLNNTNSVGSQSSSSNSNLNITPEMISNLADSIKGSTTNSNSANSSTGCENTTINSSNIDIATILKVKNIIEALNKKDDVRSNLLYSLKPYLRESRRQKVDQYVNLFKLSGLTDLLKKEKGDSN